MKHTGKISGEMKTHSIEVIVGPFASHSLGAGEDMKEEVKGKNYSCHLLKIVR